MSTHLERLGLRFNPFEPAASGAPLGEGLWLPPDWSNRLQELLHLLIQGRGTKAIAIAGEYGSGKTYVLQWLYRQELPKRQIRPFYFDNPGVQFYDLANALLRQIGRKNFAKCLWELAAPHVSGYQRSLFARGFEEYLIGQRTSRRQQEIPADLQSAILKAGVTSDEEIAYRLARIIAETPTKPYFEYRDFVAGKRDSLVAEGEEAPYFKAILRTLQLAGGVSAVAFLIDEFEEISLQKRLTRREAHDYLATLKRLINLTQSENLWLIVAMTPHAAEETRMLEPALWERFTGEGQYQFEIPPLTTDNAIDLVKFRLDAARVEDFTPPNHLFPFPDSFGTALSPADYLESQAACQGLFLCH
jgi:type II secretory pathway predicted ATPase ExeA